MLGVLSVALGATGWAVGAGHPAQASDGSAVTTTTVVVPTPSTTSTTSIGTTTSTTDPGSSTTTTDPGSTTTSTITTDIGPGGSTTTTAPADGSVTAPTGISSGSSTTTSVPPADPRLEAEARSVSRTPPSSTGPLLAALSPLQRFGLTPLQTALVGFGSFPVAGPATYTDDWLEYRATPTPHLHQGIDIDAAQGTPLRSPTDGVLVYSNSDPDGYGLTAVVTQPDGTTYVMAHMSATVLGLSNGSQVRTGQVVGFVGSSGDATGPHCHFEVHPHGGPGVDGKTLLDLWLQQALDAAPALITAFQDARSAADQPRVEPVPVSVPQAHLLGSRPRSRLSTTASLRAPAWSAAGTVRTGGLAGLLALGGAGTLVAARRRRRTDDGPGAPPEGPPGNHEPPEGSEGPSG